MKIKFSIAPELEDDQWILDLCFLVGITKKLHKLNVKLQGNDKVFKDCYKNINLPVLVAKLKLCENQLEAANAVYFPLFNSLSVTAKNFLNLVSKSKNIVDSFLKKIRSLIQI